ncbi:M24 family metallopeptidase [Candidatus Poribacteria bacterium]|nr:M24 family metallopeptidase [Candidatus Poribacteria bacterium]
MYKTRRDKFMSHLKDGAAIFGSAPGCRHKYRQDSNFYYLTGFKEPESVCVLAPEHPEHKFILFVRPKDKKQEIWTGKRAGVEAAVELYGADAAYKLDEIDKELPKYFEKIENIYYTLGSNENLDKMMLNILKKFRGHRYDTLTGPVAIMDPAEVVHNMRAIKDEHEIDLMHKAAEISSYAHIEAMKAAKPGMYEYELQAIIEQTFLKNGADYPAYPTIAGTGTNATCLHYDENNCIIQDGDLILIDAGAEYMHYSGDITRTFPANGKFSDIQKELYDIVLKANMKAIEVIKPGVKFDEFHKKALDVLVDGLIEIGLLADDRDKIMEEKEYNKFYMHNTGHWIGLDTHDVGRHKLGNEIRVFEPGMVVTVEPGLYVAEDMEDVDQKYRGLGIRIEDNVLVTEEGNEVTTYKTPKTIEDIESIMNL